MGPPGLGDKSRLSGAQERKKKRKRVEENRLLGECMQKFVRRNPNCKADDSPNHNPSVPQASEIKFATPSASNEVSDAQAPVVNGKPNCSIQNSVNEHASQNFTQNEASCPTEAVGNSEDDVLCPSKRFLVEEGWPTDPALYLRTDVVNCDSLRQQIIKHGPCRPTMCGSTAYNFPVVNGRHFPTSYYEKCLQSGERVSRTWLCYSPKLDRAFCFACWLFSDRANSLYEPNFSEIGVHFWKNLGKKIQKHESSGCHLDAMAAWKLWANNKTVDSHIQESLNKEASLLRNVFHRLLDIILYLASENMAFRGSDEKLTSTRNCGKFLSLVHLLSKYDSVLQAHLDSQSREKYLSHNIQNELIQLAGNEVLETLKQEMQSAKYFSIIADTTTDIGHIDQLSVVIRYVQVGENAGSCVQEVFTGFSPISDAKASGLSSSILEIIEKKLNLDLEDCRGQGYDGAAVMSGAYNSVSQKILEKQPLAYYMHCASHCLNLVLCDAAATSVEVITFFGVLQKLYTFLSSSNVRWRYFLESEGETDHTSNEAEPNNRSGCHHIKKPITVKKLCATRWESRIDSVQAVIRSFANIVNCLENLRDNPQRTCKPDELVDINSLLQHITNFQFILLLVIWEKVLLIVRVASKLLQNTNVDLTFASRVLEAPIKDMEDLRKDGFRNCCDEAESFSRNQDIEPVLAETRRRKKKKLAGELCSDEPPTTTIKLFECNVYNAMLDALVTQMKLRLKGFTRTSTRFNFLNPAKMGAMKPNDFKMACSDMSHYYSNDVHETQLYAEITSFKGIIPDELKAANTTCIDVLSYITKNNLQEVYPNLTVAYRILLTLPVSVASNERSFSKLKLIKNYLRHSMSQERLTALALLSIENDVARKIDYDSIISSFSFAKAQRTKKFL